MGESRISARKSWRLSAAVGGATGSVPFGGTDVSSDGKTIAFDETDVAPTGTFLVRSVAVNTDAAATANTEITLAVSGALSGSERLSCRMEFAKPVIRLAGADRLAIASVQGTGKARTPAAARALASALPSGARSGAYRLVR